MTLTQQQDSKVQDRSQSPSEEVSPQGSNEAEKAPESTEKNHQHSTSSDTLQSSIREVQERIENTQIFGADLLRQGSPGRTSNQLLAGVAATPGTERDREVFNQLLQSERKKGKSRSRYFSPTAMLRIQNLLAGDASEDLVNAALQKMKNLDNYAGVKTETLKAIQSDIAEGLQAVQLKSVLSEEQVERGGELTLIEDLAEKLHQQYPELSDFPLHDYILALLESAQLAPEERMAVDDFQQQLSHPTLRGEALLVNLVALLEREKIDYRTLVTAEPTLIREIERRLSNSEIQSLEMLSSQGNAAFVAERLQNLEKSSASATLFKLYVTSLSEDRLDALQIHAPDLSICAAEIGGGELKAWIVAKLSGDRMQVAALDFNEILKQESVPTDQVVTFLTQLSVSDLKEFSRTLSNLSGEPFQVRLKKSGLDPAAKLLTAQLLSPELSRDSYLVAILDYGSGLHGNEPKLSWLNSTVGILSPEERSLYAQRLEKLSKELYSVSLQERLLESGQNQVLAEKTKELLDGRLQNSDTLRTFEETSHVFQSAAGERVELLAKLDELIEKNRSQAAGVERNIEFTDSELNRAVNRFNPFAYLGTRTALFKSRENDRMLLSEFNDQHQELVQMAKELRELNSEYKERSKAVLHSQWEESEEIGFHLTELEKLQERFEGLASSENLKSIPELNRWFQDQSSVLAAFQRTERNLDSAETTVIYTKRGVALVGGVAVMAVPGVGPLLGAGAVAGAMIPAEVLGAYFRYRNGEIDSLREGALLVGSESLTNLSFAGIGSGVGSLLSRSSTQIAVTTGIKSGSSEASKVVARIHSRSLFGSNATRLDVTRAGKALLQQVDDLLKPQAANGIEKFVEGAHTALRYGSRSPFGFIGAEGAATTVAGAGYLSFEGQGKDQSDSEDGSLKNQQQLKRSEKAPEEILPIQDREEEERESEIRSSVEVIEEGVQEKKSEKERKQEEDSLLDEDEDEEQEVPFLLYRQPQNEEAVLSQPEVTDTLEPKGTSAELARMRAAAQASLSSKRREEEGLDFFPDEQALASKDSENANPMDDFWVRLDTAFDTENSEDDGVAQRIEEDMRALEERERRIDAQFEHFRQREWLRGRPDVLEVVEDREDALEDGIKQEIAERRSEFAAEKRVYEGGKADSLDLEEGEERVLHNRDGARMEAREEQESVAEEQSVREMESLRVSVAAEGLLRAGEEQVSWERSSQNKKVSEESIQRAVADGQERLKAGEKQVEDEEEAAKQVSRFEYDSLVDVRRAPYVSSISDYLAKSKQAEIELREEQRLEVARDKKERMMQAQWNKEREESFKKIDRQVEESEELVARAHAEARREKALERESKFFGLGRVERMEETAVFNKRDVREDSSIPNELTGARRENDFGPQARKLEESNSGQIRESFQEDEKRGYAFAVEPRIEREQAFDRKRTEAFLNRREEITATLALDKKPIRSLAESYEPSVVAKRSSQKLVDGETRSSTHSKRIRELSGVLLQEGARHLKREVGQVVPDEASLDSEGLTSFIELLLSLGSKEGSIGEFNNEEEESVATSEPIHRSVQSKGKKRSKKKTYEEELFEFLQFLLEQLRRGEIHDWEELLALLYEHSPELARMLQEAIEEETLELKTATKLAETVDGKQIEVSQGIEKDSSLEAITEHRDEESTDTRITRADLLRMIKAQNEREE